MRSTATRPHMRYMKQAELANEMLKGLSESQRQSCASTPPILDDVHRDWHSLHSARRNAAEKIAAAEAALAKVVLEEEAMAKESPPGSGSTVAMSRSPRSDDDELDGWSHEQDACDLEIPLEEFHYGIDPGPPARPSTARTSRPSTATGPHMQEAELADELGLAFRKLATFIHSDLPMENSVWNIHSHLPEIC